MDKKEVKKLIKQYVNTEKQLPLLKSKLYEAGAVHECNGTCAQEFFQCKEDVITVEGRGYCSIRCMQDYEDTPNQEPFCSQCKREFELGDTIIRIQEISSDGYNTVTYYCNTDCHKKSFEEIPFYAYSYEEAFKRGDFDMKIEKLTGYLPKEIIATDIPLI